MTGNVAYPVAWGGRAASETCREAVLAALAENPDLAARFASACHEGAPAVRSLVLPVRAELRRHGHRFATRTKQFEETFHALLAAAEDLLPETSGAVRGRLRERVQDDVRPRPEGGVRIVGDVPARRAVEVVLAHEDAFFEEFVVAAGRGHEGLYAVARRVRDALARTGREYPAAAVEDELWVLVRELLPGAPAARPAEERLWSLWTLAEEYVEEHDPDGALGDEERGRHEIPAHAATKRHDLPGLRAALREMCRAARDAARETNGNDGNDGDEGDGNEE